MLLDREGLPRLDPCVYLTMEQESASDPHVVVPLERWNEYTQAFCRRAMGLKVAGDCDISMVVPL